MSCDHCSAGSLSRRDFVALSAAAIAAGCTSPGGGAPAGGASHVVDAGPVGQLGRAGVSTAHREEGFFLTHAGGQVVALSSYCTHRHCLLDVLPDRSFHCPCHGSDFDPAGQVVRGPASRSLPVLPTSVNGHGHLLVTVTG